MKDRDGGLRTPKGKGSPGVRYCIVSCEFQREARADAKGWLLEPGLEQEQREQRTVSALATDYRASCVRTFTQIPRAEVTSNQSLLFH